MFNMRLATCSTSLVAAVIFIGCQDNPPRHDGAGSKPAGGEAAARGQTSPPEVDGGSGHSGVELREEPEPDEETIAAAAEQSRRNRDAARKAEIADDIPVYPDSEPIGIHSGGSQTTMSWETPDPKRKVMEFFTARLTESGWEITTTLSFGRIEAKKERRTLTIDIASGTNPPTQIMVIERRG